MAHLLVMDVVVVIVEAAVMVVEVALVQVVEEEAAQVEGVGVNQLAVQAL
jgi:hypothetical protein